MNQPFFRASVLALVLVGAGVGAAQAQDRYVLIVSGVSGSEKIAASQKEWVTSLQNTLRGKLGLQGDHIVTLTEDGTGPAAASKEGVGTAFAALRPRLKADDTLMVVLIGHGTYADNTAKFNLVGPDMDTKEWKKALDAIPARVVFVNTTSSSFPFVQDLAAKNRIVISATDSAAQRYDTMFPQYFIEGLDKLATADLDKNGRLSVWEAFVYASQAVKQAFDQKGTLVTERAVMDDSGDGVGKQATATGAGGVLSKTTFLDAEPASIASNPQTAALEKQRITLEAQIEELKGHKDLLPAAEYDAQLEKLAVELARVSAQIRAATK